MYKRLIAFLSVLSLFLSSPHIPANAAAKAGGGCSKVGLTEVASGKIFTCIKSGKKLVWNNGKNSAIDSLSHKNPMLYGIKNGMLTRKADSKAIYETDSRKITSFDQIRINAYNELNKEPRSTSHPHTKFIYSISDSFPAFLTTYLKRELDEAAALWESAIDKNIEVDVSFVTEKDRESIKKDQWLNLNLPATFDRFDGRRERPFISGGGGYWERDGKLRGRLYLATASYLDLSYINYEWPQVAKHEFVHVVQDYFFAKDGRNRPDSVTEFEKVQPNNFREGGANTISYLTAFRNIGWASDALDWNLWSLYRENSTWKPINSLEDAKNLVEATEMRTPNQAFEMSYPIGALMYEWVLGTYGLDGFKKILQQLSTSNLFDASIKKALGISKAEFTNNVATYIYKNSVRLALNN